MNGPLKFRTPVVISLLFICVFAAVLLRPSSGKAEPVNFNAERAFEDLKKQVNFGPRTPDSPGIHKTREYILSELARNGFTTGTQPFTARSELLGQMVEGVNLYGTYPPGKPVKYIFSAHYDTRPISDMVPVGPRRNLPVPGANDGASGVAVLLEVARALKADPPRDGVALVFFDLEDHGLPTAPEGFCQGSRFMAGNLPEPLKGFQAGVNLDMVADKELLLRIEGYSMQRAPDVAKAFWNAGLDHYPEVFSRQTMGPITDDHVPFLQAGFPYIDVIDLDYKYWHTPDDTPDKCSPDSLRAVGETVLRFLRR